MNRSERLFAYVRPAATTLAVMILLGIAACGDSTGPTTGDLRTNANTSGTDLDPDGYVATLVGGASRALGANGSVVFSSQEPGQYEVLLDDVADNCAVAGSNPRSVSVAAGGTAETTFVVTCQEITGALDVSTSTTGEDLDADGYTLSVSGAPNQSIGTAETVTVSGLSPGSHDVSLGDVAPNCTVAGDNPRALDVPAGGTASTTFDIACTALTGDIAASTTTTGTDIDPDGYDLIVDAGSPIPIGVNDTETVSGLAPGSHTVELADVAGNCAVAGGNTMMVDVPAGGSVPADFTVSCAEQVGSIEVTTVTWGLNTDNSYNITVDGSGGTAISGNDTETLNAVPIGDRVVELTGIKNNCTVQGQNPRTETVTEGATTATTFDVFCFQTLSNKIVYESRRGSEPGDLYVMNTDGSGKTRLTIDPGTDREPDVSSSGTAVVFESDRAGSRNIWMLDASGIRNLTNTTGQHRSPTLRGDGARVAYARRSGNSWNLYSKDTVVGGPVFQITDTLGDDDQPAWSPDGTMILFRSNRSDGVNWDLYVVDANGSNLTRLTTDASHDGKPAWSSDGTQIAWSGNRSGTFDIWIADFDAGTRTISGLANITPASAGTDGKSDWRPGQAQVAYASDNSSLNDVITMNSDGSGKTNLTNSVHDDREPSWSP